MPCGQQESGGAAPARYVVGVDVGSTVVKCHVYDRAAAVRGSSCRKVESLYPHPGWVELDPEVLWSQFVGVIKEAVQAAGLHMRQIAGLGISTQRATFITWHKRTGKPFHNFISWQDLRSAELVNSWNKSLLLKVKL
uniref:Carbohydrate kinase FGGY N-terminal domain-containing protein n=1 Tax=Strix occidentalis caurina TaxID=311401 RepID=A0A8D0F294_STROC